MHRPNCWEVVDCGREPGGLHAATLGTCAAALDITADGINGGINGGRICWAVVGTDCRGSRGRDGRHKRILCDSCSFYKRVLHEEGLQNVQLSRPGLIAR